MHKEFAVEPHAIETWTNFRVVVGDCGVDKGRVVADFPKNQWIRKVRELFSAHPSNSEMQVKKAVEMLSNLKKALVRSGRTYHEAKGWIDNAVLSDLEKPFAAIILNNPKFKNDRVLHVGEISAADQLWKVDTNLCVNREASAIARCAQVLVSISSELLLIDPHFDPLSERWRETLSEILQMAKATSRAFHRIQYHVEVKSREPESGFKADCEKILPKFIPRGWTLGIYRWERKVGGEGLHARYLLTDRGGISFDFGLDRGRAGETTDVHLLSQTVYERRWANYQESTSEFKLIDSFCVGGQA